MAVNSRDDSNARLVIVSRRLSINGAFNLSCNCVALVRRELADNDTAVITQRYRDAELASVGFISADGRERLYSDGANRVIGHKLIRSFAYRV